MATHQRNFEEMVLCLLLKKITTDQLDFFIDIYINDDNSLNLEIKCYVRKHVIPLLIENLTFIKDNNIIEEEKLDVIKTHYLVAKPMYELLIQTQPKEFTRDTFSNFLLSILSIKTVIPENCFTLIFNTLRACQSNKEMFQIFFDSFYLSLKPDNRYKVISAFLSYNNEKIKDDLCEVFELNGLPGVVYAPVIIDNDKIDLIDKVITIETLLGQNDLRNTKSYIASITVYDFYTQLMISYDINIELYALHYINGVVMEIRKEDFAKTLQQFLSEYKIDLNSTIQLVIKPLSEKLYGNIYFDDNNRNHNDNNKVQLKNNIQKLLDLWWLRIENTVDMNSPNINKAIKTELQCQIQDTIISDIVEKEFMGAIEISKNNVMNFIAKRQQPCFLHFIIGFTNDKSSNQIKPYLRNTIFITLPRYLFALSYAEEHGQNQIKDNNSIEYISQSNSKANIVLNKQDYHSYFNYWLKIKGTSSAYIKHSNANEFNALLNELPNKKKCNNTINIISKMLFEALQTKQEFEVLQPKDILEVIHSIDLECLYESEYQFIFYYSVLFKCHTIDFQKYFPCFCRNYLRFTSKVPDEIAAIQHSLFNYFKTDIAGTSMIPNWFNEFFGTHNWDNNFDNKTLLLWHFIEVINRSQLKLSFSLSYADFKILIPSHTILQYINRGITDLDAHMNKINQFFLFAGTYYCSNMIKEEIEFNSEVKERLLNGTITEPNTIYSIYYYLIKTNQLAYPVPLYKATNLKEMKFSSLLLQLYTIDIFQLKLRENLKDNEGIKGQEEATWINLFQDLDNNNLNSLQKYKGLQETNFDITELIRFILPKMCGEINQLNTCINLKELLTTYSETKQFTSDILIIKHNQVLNTIKDHHNNNHEGYTLKGYWIEVNQSMNLYYTYCKINSEWFIYTSNLQRVNWSEMIKASQSEIILIYVRTMEKIGTKPLIHTPDNLLLDAMMLNHPCTLIDLAYTNPLFINYFFKSSTHLNILKELVNSLKNNKDQLKERTVQRLCRYLLTNYEREAETNEFFTENILRHIQELFKQVREAKIEEGIKNK